MYQLSGCDCMMGGAASRDMHGGLDDTIVAYINDAIFGTKAAKIDPASEAAKAKAEFYANVIAKSGQKFVESPQGVKVIDKAIDKFTIYSFVPGLLIGAVAGYWLARRMK